MKLRLRTIICLTTSICTVAEILPPRYAVAQSAPDSGTTAVATNSDQLEELVITARKREEEIQTAPLSVTAFSGAKLEQMNVTNLDQLAGVVPNLTLYDSVSYVGGIEITIRGIGEPDPIMSNDSPIALYLDGVLLARNVGLPMNFVDLDRVEVLRGPQGTLFGRNTTGGAINIVTKEPSDTFDLSQKVDYASNNEVTSRTVVDTGDIGDSRIRAKLTYQHHQMDGYVRNTLTSDADEWPGADDTDTLYFVLRGDISDDFHFDYRFDYTSQSTVLPNYQITVAQPGAYQYFGQSPLYGGAPYQVSPTRFGAAEIYPIGPRDTLETLGHALTLEYAVSSALNFKLISAYRSLVANQRQSFDTQGLMYGPVINPVTFAPAGIQEVFPYELACSGTSDTSCDVEHQYQISEELQVSGVIDRFKYLGGLYYFDEHIGENAPQYFTLVLGPSTGLNIAGANVYTGASSSYASFGELSYTPPIFDDRLELTGGVRYTRDEKSLDSISSDNLLSHRFNALSGDFTANFQWTPDLMSYFRFANSYKAGGFNAREGTAPAYAPEYANNYEVGFKSDWFEKHLRLNADVFYTTYSNQQIDTTPASSGGILGTETINAGESTYLGGELEATVIPAHGWEFDTSIGYTDPEFQKFPFRINGVVTNISNIVDFPNFSKLSFHTGVQYSFDPWSFGDLSIRTDFHYKSRMVFFANPLESPYNDQIAADAEKSLSADITLAHIPTNFGRSELTATVYGRNLLNQAYRVEGVDFSAFAPAGFAVNAYSRPLVVGFNVTLTY
jgi:iron complex outermembrane receptor protein